jgi:heme exporter protein D
MVKGLTLLNDLPFWVNANGRQASGLFGTLLLWVLAGISLAMVTYLIRCYFQERRKLRSIQRRLRTNGQRRNRFDRAQTRKSAIKSAEEVLSGTGKRAA